MEKKYTAFIFARGGSKGVKNKNIRLIANKPLISHSIETALSSKYIKKVIVSTDCPDIARVSTEYGASVLIRPDELAGDKSPELLSWKHAIEMCNTRGAEELFISLPATSPLRSSDDINNAIDKYLEGNCDIVFGITPSQRSPYLNMVKVNSSDHIEILISGSGALRRQDVPDAYDITTCVYVGSADYILNNDSIMSGKVGHINIPIQRSIDIDTEFDLYLADLMLKKPFKNCKEI